MHPLYASSWNLGISWVVLRNVKLSVLSWINGYFLRNFPLCSCIAFVNLTRVDWFQFGLQHLLTVLVNYSIYVLVLQNNVLPFQNSVVGLIIVFKRALSFDVIRLIWIELLKINCVSLLPHLYISVLVFGLT